MAIEYIDRKHAKLIVSIGTGKDRKRRTKLIEYNGKKDAQVQYEEFKKEVKGETEISRDMTVNELLGWYINLFKSKGGKPTTIRAYKTSQKAINSRFNRVLAHRLTLYQLQNYVSLETKSPKTLKNEISLLNSAYKNAIRFGLLKENPCQFVQLPKQVKPDIETLTEKEVPIFIGYLNDSVIDFKVMCELALFCGMRRSEILGLRYDDIGEQITINKVRHHMYGKDIIETPKTKTSIRTLSIPTFILEDIETLKAEQSKRPSKSDYLIQNLWGEPVSGYWTDKRMREFLDKHKCLPKVTLHGLRHTYTSMLIANGIPISEVSAELGHASVDITLRTYTHLFKDSSTASKRISSMFDEKMALSRHSMKKESQQPQLFADSLRGADERIRTF